MTLARSTIVLVLFAATTGCDSLSDGLTANNREAWTILSPGAYRLVAGAMHSFPTDDCVGTGTFVGISIVSPVTVTRGATCG
jgi:hypothetical protein